MAPFEASTCGLCGMSPGRNGRPNWNGHAAIGEPLWLVKVIVLAVEICTTAGDDASAAARFCMLVVSEPIVVPVGSPLTTIIERTCAGPLNCASPSRPQARVV